MRKQIIHFSLFTFPFFRYLTPHRGHRSELRGAMIMGVGIRFYENNSDLMSSESHCMVHLSLVVDVKART